jgi:hypothetical protein
VANYIWAVLAILINWVCNYIPAPFFAEISKIFSA